MASENYKIKKINENMSVNQNLTPSIVMSLHELHLTSQLYCKKYYLQKVK